MGQKDLEKIEKRWNEVEKGFMKRKMWIERLPDSKNGSKYGWLHSPADYNWVWKVRIGAEPTKKMIHLDISPFHKVQWEKIEEFMAEHHFKVGPSSPHPYYGMKWDEKGGFDTYRMIDDSLKYQRYFKVAKG